MASVSDAAHKCMGSSAWSERGDKKDGKQEVRVQPSFGSHSRVPVLRPTGGKEVLSVSVLVYLQVGNFRTYLRSASSSSSSSFPFPGETRERSLIITTQDDGRDIESDTRRCIHFARIPDPSSFFRCFWRNHSLYKR